MAKEDGELIEERPPRAHLVETPGASCNSLMNRGLDGAAIAQNGRTYDVLLDGRRFLMIKPTGPADPSGASASFVVVRHWVDELKRLVPTK